MQVKILRTTVADKKFVMEGSVVDVSDFDARSLVLLGKAVMVEPIPLDTVAAEPLISTDAPKRRGRGRGVL